MAYCLPADLYSYGLPYGALASPGRLVDSVSVAEDSITLDAHGFAAGTPVQFRAVGGGSLPDPVASGVTYYASPLDDWRFQVALTVDGAAIDLTTAGTTFQVYASLPVEATIEKASRRIDDMIPAHLVPLSDPVPDIVRMTAAELAAADLLAITGGASEALTAVYDRAQKRIARWARNVAIRGTNAPPTAQRSLSSVNARPAHAWKRYGGIA